MRRLYGTQALQYRPYEPVIVNEEIDGIAVRYVGEVMSFIITERAESYMVRRVPNHPGTLFEAQVTQLSRPLTKARRYFVHYAVVETTRPSNIGWKYFPVDMLRYECAAPVNFKIVGDFTCAELTLPDEHRLIIACATVKNNPQWEERRWKSFAWNITPLTTEKWEVK